MLVHCNQTFFCEYTLYNLSKLCLLSCNTTNYINFNNNNDTKKQQYSLLLRKANIVEMSIMFAHRQKNFFVQHFFSDLLSAIVALCFVTTVQVKHIIQSQEVHHVNISTAVCSRVSLSIKKVHSLSSYTVQQHLPLASNREFVCVFQG